MVARASFRWRVLVAAFIAAGVAVLAAAYTFSDDATAGGGWSWFTPNACLAAERCFCEAAHPGPLAQPANAMSNVGFFLAALAIAAQIDRRIDRRSPVDARDVAFAILVAFLGVGSIALHATLTMLGGRVDVSSMILFTALLAADALTSTVKRALAAFAAFASSALLLYAIVPPLGNGIFGALTLVFAVHELARRRTRFLAAGGACFALAFALWLPSQTHGALCEPSSLLQGHAAWHLLCAASTFLLFRHREARRALLVEA
jgi:hypothetical protein